MPSSLLTTTVRVLRMFFNAASTHTVLTIVLFFFSFFFSSSDHRALDDVIAMVKLFHLVPFSDLLSCLVVRSPQEQLQRWENRASGKA